MTQELWQAVMGNSPSEFSGDQHRPVECEPREICQMFISKLKQITGKKFRLPTEAEWEYAARCGNKSQGFSYAGSDSVDEVAWCSSLAASSQLSSTQTVATKVPNRQGKSRFIAFYFVNWTKYRNFVEIT